MNNIIIMKTDNAPYLYPLFSLRLKLPLKHHVAPLHILLPPLLHPERPVRRHGDERVEHDVRPEDPKVPPPVVPVDFAPGHELVRHLQRAVPAVGRRVRVLQAAGGLLQVRLHVLPAGLSRRGAEHGRLGGGAVDGAVVELRGDDAADPVSEGAEPVHEDPEAGEGVGSLEDTAEGEAHDDEEGDDGCGGLGVGKGGDGHLREGGGVEEELDAVKEDEALALRGLDADDGVVEACED